MDTKENKEQKEKQERIEIPNAPAKNYAAEKAEVEKDVRRWKLIVLFCVVGVLLAFCIFGAFVKPSGWKYHFSKPSVTPIAEGECRVHFLNVGQGDCTLIEFPNGKKVMIDGGSWQDSATSEKYILRYLNALDIDEIDALIVTHSDEDHCNALVEILEYKKVQQVWLPKIEPVENSSYGKFHAALNEKGIAKETADRLTDLHIDENCTFSVLYPRSQDATISAASENTNQNSMVLWLDYKGSSVLFTGDSPKETEELLVKEDKLGLFKIKGISLASTEVLKVSHHGSRYSTSEEFLQYLKPSEGIISCGVNNNYSHPHAEVLERLSKENAKTYRTDQNGTILLTMQKDGTYGFTYEKGE